MRNTPVQDMHPGYAVFYGVDAVLKLGKHTASQHSAVHKILGLLHRHLQHLIDVLAFVAHLQGLPVVPLALAHLAGHVDVGEEVHLNFQQAVALAGLAAPAPDIEGEAARAVALALASEVEANRSRMSLNRPV